MIEADADVASILEALAEVTPTINRTLCDVAGRSTVETAGENESGDERLAVDRRVDRRLQDQLTAVDAVGTYASEERSDLLDVGEGYTVAVDPVDGSSNLRPNTVTGTVVGVYDDSVPARGRDLVASTFVLYGPTTTMTVATDDRCVRYVIDDGAVVSADPVSIPETSEICGAARSTAGWPPELRDHWRELRRTHKLRYTGAMVGDVAHLLDRGGLLAYPPQSGGPDGVLRLQYESNPIAHIVETAGGRSSTGHGSILDADPDTLHQRIPTYFGNPDRIAEIEALYAE
ncbi:fructose-1,6-bisphosphatase [Halobacteria archaeon AArc-dxtr1]|nr:fructose-1,6-bisphosphatase [Halobacteria archaeon AArc-dxtr1]